jgi:PAS domain-containing protein
LNDFPEPEFSGPESAVPDLPPACAALFGCDLVGFVLLRTGAIVLRNAAAERLLDADAGSPEPGGRLHPVDRLLQAELARHVPSIDADEMVRFEHFLHRRSGPPRWIEVQGGRLPGTPPGSAPLDWFALTDIDAQRRGARALGALDGQLQTLLEAMPVAAVLRSHDEGRLLQVNSAAQDLLGLPRASLLGRAWHEIYDRHLARLLAHLDDCARAGVAAALPTLPLPRPDGTARMVRPHVLRLDGDAAVPARWLTVFEDLQPLRAADEARRTAEALLQGFADEVESFLFVATPNLERILYASVRCLAVTGLTAAELVAEPLAVRRRVVPSDLARLLPRLPRLLAGLRQGRRTGFSVRLAVAGGERALEVRLNPVRLPGREWSVLGVASQKETAVPRYRGDSSARESATMATLLEQDAGATGAMIAAAAAATEAPATGATEAGPWAISGAPRPLLTWVQDVCEEWAQGWPGGLQFQSEAPALRRWLLVEDARSALHRALETVLDAAQAAAPQWSTIRVQAAGRVGGLALCVDWVDADGRPLPPDAVRLAPLATLISTAPLLPAGARVALPFDGGECPVRLELEAPAIVDASPR